MPNQRCCVGGCDNDSRYPERIIKRGHVEGELRWHSFPKDAKKKADWTKQISKGRDRFEPTGNTYVCSNHFRYGKPTFGSPIPTEFLVASNNTKQSPKKRRTIVKTDAFASVSAKVKCPNSKDAANSCTIISPLAYHSLTFAVLTREHDSNLFTGLTCKEFQCVFEYLMTKAERMHYWKGEKDANKDTTKARIVKQRALSLEQEFLMTMMKFKLGLFLYDLAFRFNVSEGTVSSVLTTWIKLMAKELKWLIAFPERNIIIRNLPSMFQKYYPRCRVIIDCTEIFIETPSSLEVAAMCWSNYKQHYTAKFLIGITPNGHISFVSDMYGGRASDAHIVKDTGFCNYLQPYDQVMADRGFKIQDVLAFYQCSLAIPPSKHTNLQMSAADVRETSKIANVRIYVEQAIKRIKDFHLIGNEIPISLLPLLDDIVIVCCALCNLHKPLSK